MFLKFGTSGNVSVRLSTMINKIHPYNLLVYSQLTFTFNSKIVLKFFCYGSFKVEFF